MAKHPSTPIAAQSGNSPIDLSVKTLEHGLAWDRTVLTFVLFTKPQRREQALAPHGYLAAIGGDSKTLY